MAMPDDNTMIWQGEYPLLDNQFGYVLILLSNEVFAFGISHSEAHP